jgi:lipoyl(octanoyl) transferase
MSAAAAISRTCEVRRLGRVPFAEAYELQRHLVAERQAGRIPDQLLLLEHPPVVTMGRNGQAGNLLVTPALLAARGIEFHETDRGGDVTYHGPGQIVGYPILDLNQWKRDVHLYVRALEQVLISAIEEFGIPTQRIAGMTGVWTATEPAAKLAAIGVHISRWVTSHGFALNVDPDLQHFSYIVPCGLSLPVTSLRASGCPARWDDVAASIERHFLKVFEFDHGDSHD